MWLKPYVSSITRTRRGPSRVTVGGLSHIVCWIVASEPANLSTQSAGKWRAQSASSMVSVARNASGRPPFRAAVRLDSSSKKSLSYW